MKTSKRKATPPSSASKTRSLDIRALIARGEEPRDKVTALFASLPSGEAVTVSTPFLPSPLIERQQAEGFQARTERRSDRSWQTLFWRD